MPRNKVLFMLREIQQPQTDKKKKIKALWLTSQNDATREDHLRLYSACNLNGDEAVTLQETHRGRARVGVKSEKSQVRILGVESSTTLCDCAFGFIPSELVASSLQGR